MLGFIYHHKSFPDDLKEDIEYTIKRCARQGVEHDAHMIDQILSYKKNEAPVTSPSTTASTSVLQDMNSKLDNFLSMFDTDDSDDAGDSNDANSSMEVEKTAEVVDLSMPFTCSLCHENHMNSTDDVPMLLCHLNPSFNSSGLRRREHLMCSFGAHARNLFRSALPQRSHATRTKRIL